MEAVLLRSASVPVRLAAPSGSSKPSLSRHDSVTGVFPGSQRISLHLRTNRLRYQGSSPTRRALSESDVFSFTTEISSGSRTIRGAISEDYTVDGSDTASFPSVWPEYGIPIEELGICGGGFGKGGTNGGDRGDGSSNDDKSKISDYYREMLRLNPGDSLLLRNYAKFLHEVEKDTEKAEEYYGRAILASPGDGEVLSLYGKLIWETKRDETRAKSYLVRAVHASPNDCMVLGSYAQFMWEAEEEEEEEFGTMEGSSSTAAMVEAF